MIRKLTQLLKIFTEEITEDFHLIRSENMALFQELLIMTDKEVKALHIIDLLMVKTHHIPRTIEMKRCTK